MDPAEVREGVRGDLLAAEDGVGQGLPVVLRVLDQVFLQLVHTAHFDLGRVDQLDAVVFDVAEGERFPGVVDGVEAQGLQEAVHLRVVDVVAGERALLVEFLLPEFQAAGELYHIVEDLVDAAELRAPVVHEEVLRVLAAAAFAGAQLGQVGRELDDGDIEEGERDLLHLFNAGLVDIVEDVELLRDLAERGVFVRREVRGLAIKPADVISRAADVQGVGGAAANDQLLPGQVLLFAVFVVRICRHDEGIRLGAVCLLPALQEFRLSGDQAFGLLTDPEEAQLAERLVDLAVGAVVVVVDRIVRGRADLPAVAFGVFPGDVRLHGLQLEEVADLLRDLVAEQIQLRLRELAVFAQLDGDLVLRWHLLHRRLGLAHGAAAAVPEQIGRELLRDPFQGLREFQVQLALDQRDRRVGLRVGAAFVLDEPGAVLLEDGAAGLAVVAASDAEIAPAAEADGGLRVEMQDHGLAAFGRGEDVFFGYAVVIHKPGCCCSGMRSGRRICARSSQAVS